jgi:hypothetical protein
MLVITGFFRDEKFVPDIPISIPQNKKVVLTIEEEQPLIKTEMSWREICNEILNCDEELIGEPQPVKFRTIAEMEAL